MRGHLVQHGWGTEPGYPAIQLDPDGVPVVGQVLTSEPLDEHGYASTSSRTTVTNLSQRSRASEAVGT